MAIGAYDIARAEDAAERAGKRSGRLAGALIAAIVVGAVITAVMIGWFVRGERTNELRIWQDRMAGIADSRAAAVGQWVAAAFDPLTDLANNVTVQLYTAELLRGEGFGGARGELAAQAEYLRNLLILSASEGGFDAPPAGADVPASVQRIGRAGIAIVEPGGTIVVASPGMPPIDEVLAGFPGGLQGIARRLSEITRDRTGSSRLAFAVPLFDAQTAGEPRPIAYVVGVRQASGTLRQRLRPAGDPYVSSAAALIEPRGGTYRPVLSGGEAAYASPDSGGAELPRSAAEVAVRSPGSFAMVRGQGDKEVMTTSSRVSGTPWLMVYTIDREEGLGASDSLFRRLLIALLLCVGAVTALIFALWRHGASRRSGELAQRYRNLTATLEAQNDFLDTLSRNQPDRIYVVDQEGRLEYANHAAAAAAGLEPEEIREKSLAAVFGPKPAEELFQRNASALTGGRPVRASFLRSERDEAETAILADHVPMAPHGSRQRVLVIERDISEPIRERMRRERTLARLVDILAALIDRRDPSAARHSERVSHVAGCIAREMGFDSQAIETVETAGRLMNLGKIMVPTPLLTRPGGLEAGEIESVRHTVLAVADLLSGVEFSGPVQETIRQSMEHVDGSGYPSGLVGSEILQTARVLAVANTFVALTSPRTYRAALSVDEAIHSLMADSGSRYDRAVVVALANYLENRGGRDAAELERSGNLKP